MWLKWGAAKRTEGCPQVGSGAVRSNCFGLWTRRLERGRPCPAGHGPGDLQNGNLCRWQVEG